MNTAQVDGAEITNAVAEEQHGILFWQVKTMLLVASGETKGLKPFVVSKARKFTQNYSDNELRRLSDKLVTIYHDARSAEVVSYQAQNRFHGSYEYPNSRMRQRDEKVQLNRFLSEFLTLCLEHGASSQPVSF